MVVLLLGLTYGGFLGNLALDGQVPSFTRGLPVSADEFYSLASYYVAPLFVVLTGMMATLAWRWGRTTGVSWHQSWTVVAAAYTVPILCTYVLPEWLMYVASGGQFESLTQVTRFAAPTTLLLITLNMIRAVRSTWRLTWGQSVIRTLVLALVQAGPLGVLIR